MDKEVINKIKEIYADFRRKLGDIVFRKKSLLKKYRTRIEEIKVKEIQDSLNKVPK